MSARVGDDNDDVQYLGSNLVDGGRVQLSQPETTLIEYIAATVAEIDTPKRVPELTMPGEPRAGFTHDLDDDLLAVCAGCDEELAFDADAARPTAAMGGSERNRDTPIWAIKTCGHVGSLVQVSIATT